MLVALGASADEFGTLARYSFDDGAVESGPDTFAVYAAARGRVGLSSAWRVSGQHSVELREVAGDGDFAELQGWFPARDRGRVYAHFALLVTDPAETLNVALAGPGGFAPGKDAIAFWLTTKRGWLVHVSDSIPKPLFEPRRLAWYRVDLAYDVLRGRYDLEIAEEGAAEPRVRLRDQPNAANAAGSSVDRFSFIGDAGGDVSNAIYYVDDVVIGTDERVQQLPFMAPGRRRLFFEVLLEERRRLHERIRCPRLGEPAELGLDGASARALLAARLLVAGGANAPEPPPSLSERERSLLGAVGAFAAGCQALERGEPELALAAFHSAEASVPGAPAYALGSALALAAAGRAEEAARRVSALERSFARDPRWPAWRAKLARASGDARALQSWLDRATDDALSQREPPPALAEAAEDAFWSDLGADRLYDAEKLARALADRAGQPTEQAAWLERAADAEVLLEDYTRALAHYQAALELDATRAGVWEKLSDLHYLRGDLEGERRCREKIWGSLDPSGG